MEWAGSVLPKPLRAPPLGRQADTSSGWGDAPSPPDPYLASLTTNTGNSQMGKVICCEGWQERTHPWSQVPPSCPLGNNHTHWWQEIFLIHMPHQMPQPHWSTVSMHQLKFSKYLSPAVYQGINEGRKISAFAQKPLKIQWSLTENTSKWSRHQILLCSQTVSVFCRTLVGWLKRKVQTDTWPSLFGCFVSFFFKHSFNGCFGF